MKRSSPKKLPSRKDVKLYMQSEWHGYRRSRKGGRLKMPGLNNRKRRKKMRDRKLSELRKSEWENWPQGYK